MARPIKEGMEYFPHDTDAVNDEKVEILKLLYGNDGYAFYFILLERIYRTPNFELDISDAETIQILCKKIEVTEDKFFKMLDTCFKKEAFSRTAYEKRKVLTSNGILKRASIVIEKRERMRNKYQQSKQGVLEAETTQETRAESTQSKVKKSKEKKSKEKKSNKDDIPKLNYAEKVTLTEDQYKKLVSKHGEKNTLAFIEKLNNAKCANKKLKYTSDYHAILNWVVDAVLNKIPKAKDNYSVNKSNTTDYDALLRRPDKKREFESEVQY